MYFLSTNTQLVGCDISLWADNVNLLPGTTGHPTKQNDSSDAEANSDNCTIDLQVLAVVLVVYVVRQPNNMSGD